MRSHHGEQGITACQGFQRGVKQTVREKINLANALSSWVLHTHTASLLPPWFSEYQVLRSPHNLLEQLLCPHLHKA